MKKKLLIFIFILIYGCQGADINNAEKRNEKWAYWVDSKTGEASWIPVSDQMTVENGDYTTFYKNGGIYERGKIKAGQHVDTVFCYSLNGNLIKYKLISRDTLLQHYIKDGPYIAHFQDGKIFEKGMVKQHKIKDKWTRYYNNGNIDWIQNLKDKTGITRWYYENGQISDSIYHIKGKTHGQIKLWFENGQIKEISNWKNGVQDGKYETYYENGNPKEIAYWIDGLREGQNISWYENGQVEYNHFYKNGERHGVVKQWYSNGNIKDILNFASGQVDGKVSNYYENGKTKGAGTYKNGNREGVFSYYDEKGKLISKQTYIKGELVEEE